ncbi:MAG: hypothetical protein KME04_19475 [Pleurocapsa minor GSE-CHR-MK-17-07R]|jgi:hypothetical protein|nr:hypothetical protein [Pleurocapsa minor GSE-CHR-MK 17-07R]
MAITVQVSAKTVGARRPVFSGWRVPIPPGSDGGSMTLRDLITAIVHHEVEAFNSRQQERRLARLMTAGEIAAEAERGKVIPGERKAGEPAGAEDAASTALLAFEDGIYIVFIDDAQQTDLEQTVFVGEDTHIMFIRLVALSGGW